MTIKTQSRIAGEFEGFDGERVFQFDNGQLWQQAVYRYRYRYRYRPQAKVWEEGGSYYLDVDGMDEMIRVRRIS